MPSLVACIPFFSYKARNEATKSPIAGCFYPSGFIWLLFFQTSKGRSGSESGHDDKNRNLYDPRNKRQARSRKSDSQWGHCFFFWLGCHPTPPSSKKVAANPTEPPPLVSLSLTWFSARHSTQFSGSVAWGRGAYVISYRRRQGRLDCSRVWHRGQLACRHIASRVGKCSTVVV